MSDDELKDPREDKPPEENPDQVQPPVNERPKPEPKPRTPRPIGNDSMGVDIGDGRFEGRATFAKDYKEINNFFSGSPGISNIVIRNFAFNDIRRISTERQQEIAELFVGDPAEIERLRSALVERRILVLSGEGGLGKTTTALYLASLLSVDSSAGNGSHTWPETYLIPALDRHTRIDLQEVCEGDEITDRVVIFKNVLARGNLDLRRYLSQLTDSIDGFAAKLRDTNSYLIFTTTGSGQLAGDLQYELRHLNDELLAEGLEKRLAHLERNAKVATERLEQLRRPDQLSIVITSLKTMPRVVRFVESYVRSGSTITIGADLGETIRQFEDITHWFQQELAGNFDVWCFTLALGLTQCAPGSRGVPWIDFEYVHRGVARYLKRQLFPVKGDVNEQPLNEVLEFAPNLSDDVYLEHCHAEVIKDPNTLADVIHFCDESYPHKLWQILLKHHRRVLTTLLPRLRELAENHQAEDDARARELCARIIGRLGEIDPDRVTLNVMNRWIESEEVRQRVNIGALYEGILGSNNERYRAYFLEVLQSLTVMEQPGEDSAPPAAANEGAVKNDGGLDLFDEKSKVLTAIAVYARIGAYEPHLHLAMNGLKDIAQNKLAPIMKDVQRIGRLVERTKREFAQETSAQEALGLLVFQDMLLDLAERLYNQQGRTFVGVQYALSSLCLSTDPIVVVRELRKWIESSNQAMGALVALMFLIKDGVASTLESVQVEVLNGDERKTCNPITAALTTGQDSVVEVARFLVTIFEAVSVTFFLPKQFQDYLRESFLSHLTVWIEDALPIESCRQAMESLLTELMRIHKRVLYKPIDSFLNSPAFLKREPELKRAFVDSILWPVR